MLIPISDFHNLQVLSQIMNTILPRYQVKDTINQLFHKDIVYLVEQVS